MEPVTMLSMEILTLDDVVDQAEEELTEPLAPWGWDITEADITVPMLRRRRDIRNALEQELKDAFPENFEEDEEISDETIVDLMNMHPEVKSSLLEILLELNDCEDAEGTHTYYPSIQHYTCAEDILKIEQISGFRESRESLPYKYEHLTTTTITLIYSNPQILPLISRMKKEQITDELIRSLLAR
jgi:hypothetical protein